MFDVLPVYIGSVLPFPITITKSYIDVNREFHSPRALSEYLLHLETNTEEYEAYFQWKRNALLKNHGNDSEIFTNEYLNYVARNVPGTNELKIHGNNIKLASCCRLCSLDRLKQNTIQHFEKQTYIAPKFTDEQVLHWFFQNV